MRPYDCRVVFGTQPVYHLVVGSRRHTCGRHPFEVRQYILFPFELSPVDVYKRQGITAHLHGLAAKGDDGGHAGGDAVHVDGNVGLEMCI